MRWIFFALICVAMAFFVLGIFKRTKTPAKALKSSEHERAMESNHLSGDGGASHH